MKYLLTVLALTLVISCKDKKQDEPVVPPVVVETPKPVVKGIYCPINEADFSPCNPNVPEVGSECSEIGKKVIGCKSVQCKEAC